MKITSSENVALEIAGAQVTIPAATLAELWIEKVRAPRPLEFATGSIGALAVRAIGKTYAEGTYMGVVRGEAGEPDYELFDLGEASERMPWKEALEWAKAQGGDLPNRRDQAVLFGNRGEGQFQREWYWSNTQYEGASVFAWIQDFDDGTQYFAPKSHGCRARAVRRVPIQ